MSKRPGDPGYAAGWCIHFRSMGHHDSCEAEVKYSDVGEVYGRMPCFLTKTGESKPDAMPCERLRRPTAEEIAAHEEWLKGRIDRTGVAMQAVFPFRKTHRGQRHVIDCPVCKTGKLHFSIAASNGHCHAQCTTDGCVGWIE